MDEAQDLVHAFAVGHNVTKSTETKLPASEIEVYTPDQHRIPTPQEYKPGIFGAILTSRLHDLQQGSEQQQQILRAAHDHHREHESVARVQVPQTPKRKDPRFSKPLAPTSGATTPSRGSNWHEQAECTGPQANVFTYAGTSATSTATPETSSAVPHSNLSPVESSNTVSTVVDPVRYDAANGENERSRSAARRNDVVAEVADVIACRRYLTDLCGALMKNGAPTHRIEQYLAASARALWIDADFIYIPGAMMCTFIDRTIHANNVELVREQEGLDLGRLQDIFNVYKRVIHEKYTAEEGIIQLENIRKRPDLYGIWFRIFLFGLASVLVGPFAFNSRPIDFGPIFILGCALGYMQLKLITRSKQFSNVFEVFACGLTAFAARGLGSIRWLTGEYVFCFSAIAQSSIAMILPGFLVLNSALEIQSRHVVSGSVRMVYALIYVLFLEFGLLLGTTVFGSIKRDAVNDVTCHIPLWFSATGGHWKLIYTQFIWVPLFSCCLAVIYQSKWRQLPVIALIAVCGYQANFWASIQLSSNLQVANTAGAFVIGYMANLYSRLFHGLAAASMFPAICCLVPGGLASSGGLVAGIIRSNQIFGNSSSISVINNGTQGFVDARNDPNSVYGGTFFNVGYSMVQVAIGMSVGLYLSALAVYPCSKKRNGPFSF